MAKSKTVEKEFWPQLDRLPPVIRLVEKLEKKLTGLAEFYGFEKIIPSFFEEARSLSPLQKAGLLDERPLVICRGRSSPEFILRPSGTLSVLRSYLSNKMNDLPHPLKFLFSGEGFSTIGTKRVDGKLEWGLVMIGEEGPISEAEIIQVIWKALEELKIDTGSMDLRINATGCSDCRSFFRPPFAAYLRGRQARLCRNCKKYLKRAPTKILVCSEEKCKMVASHAPQMLDFLCEVCKKHLKGLLEFLDETRIPYSLDTKFFKDGSWFNALIFEFIWNRKQTSPVSEASLENAPLEAEKISKVSGANPALSEKSGVKIAEGGRVSRAGELITGKKLDAASGTVFLEDLAEIFGKVVPGARESRGARVFLTQLGELAKRKSLAIMEALRYGGIEVRETLGRDSVKSQLKVAEKIGAEVALIFGQKEALDNTIIVREVSSGIQETIPQEKLIEFLKKKLRK